MNDGVKDAPAGVDMLGGLLKSGLGDRITSTTSRFFDMLADDVVLEFPFAADAPYRLDGLTAAKSFMSQAGGALKVDHMVLDTVHATTGDVTILEFRAIGKDTKTGNPYNQNYIALVTIRNGQIRYYKSYFNPLVVLQSAGRLPTPLAG